MTKTNLFGIWDIEIYLLFGAWSLEFWNIPDWDGDENQIYPERQVY